MRERVVLYMQAAMEYSWRLFERSGFVTVNEIMLGREMPRLMGRCGLVVPD